MCSWNMLEGNEIPRETQMGTMRRLAQAAVALALAAGAGATSSAAADKVRIGKSLPHLLAYTPIDIGLAMGFFQKQGIELEVTAFGGAAKQYLALASGALDLSLSSGPGMVFVTKGMPVKAVAAVVGRPYLVIVVPFDSPARTIDDLKGKTIGVAAISSVTDWAMKDVGRKKKWRPADVKTVAI